MVLSDIRSQIFLAVVLCRTVRTMDGQGKVETVFLRGIIILIRYHIITDLLDRSVLRRPDSKTSAVEQVICLRFRIPLFIDEILNYIFNKCICKIGIGSGILCDSRSLKDAVVYLIRHGFIIL